MTEHGDPVSVIHGMRTHGLGALGYLLAVVTPALAMVVGQLLLPWTDRAPHGCFSIATACSAWYGGTGPGLLTALLSVLAADYFFVAPLNEVNLIDPYDLILFLLLALSAITIGALRKRCSDGPSDPGRR